MDTTEAAHTLTLPWVEDATRQFVYAEEMRQAFSLAMAAGLNTIFSGPGGHGKSEFLMAALGAIGDVTPYVKSFGQGTSPEELYGGLDLDALNRQGGEEKAVIQYNPELSFLAHRVAVFEELFDAPSRVLTSLKDTLTARELRNGHQRFSMTTDVIFGPTNHSPQEVAEGGPEIAALIERFPIQLEVTWPDYHEDSFVELFATVTSSPTAFEKIAWSDIVTLQEWTRSAAFGSTLQRMLAKIIVELRRDEVILSPRTAVMAMQLAKAAAAINGRNRVMLKDLIAIAFLPGAHELKTRISDLIMECESSMVGEDELERLEGVLAGAAELAVETEPHVRELIQILNGVRDEAVNLKLSVLQDDRRKKLLGNVDSARAKAQESLRAFELAQKCEEHERTFKQFDEMIARFTEDIRHGSSAKRADALSGLEKTRTHLTKMSIHGELEERRNGLLMRIQLAGLI